MTGFHLLVLGLAFHVLGSEALQCFVCTVNLWINKDCRSISSAQLITCPDTSDHCNALVYDLDGRILVNRGCSGVVSSWGFGDSECDIMTHDSLLDRAVALYQCRGDGCNNVEPGEVTTVTKRVNDQTIQVPEFALSSNLRSEQSTGSDGNDVQSKAIVTEQDDLNERRGKQIASVDDDDDSYGLPGFVRRTRTTTQAPSTTTIPLTTTMRTTAAPTTKPTTQSTRTTTKEQTVPPRIILPPITRPPRRNFTVFD